MPITPPIINNELNRLIDLAELDLDYANIEDNFKDLTKLAARIAGTEISLINLIDSFTQWTLANYGLPLEQMPREDSVCQYTIAGEAPLEVKDLTTDERFKEKLYVTGPPNVTYYFGVPLRTKNGHNIGALCVMDKGFRDLNPEKVEMLKIIAGEVVNRLVALKVIHSLHNNLHEANAIKKRVAHDIRGPIGGIIGLAQMIAEKGDQNNLDEVLQFITLIHKSGNSLLELADEILNSEIEAGTKNLKLKEHELNLLLFKDKLEKLYIPQAKNKEIDFKVNINTKFAVVPFPKNKLLQITGNLISNAIKFTPSHGCVNVYLDLIPTESSHTLRIEVTDSGVGLEVKTIEDILNGNATSTGGTKGEQGFGFGLPLVKFLVDALNGEITIKSKVGEGTTFTVELPF